MIVCSSSVMRRTRPGDRWASDYSGATPVSCPRPFSTDGHVQSNHRNHPGGGARRRQRPLGDAALDAAQRARPAATAGGEAVRPAARAADVLPAAVGPDPADSGRTEGTLDARLPRLHPMSGRVSDHAGATGAGAETVDRPARFDPATRAVRLRG